jgi:hypothetical protein
MTEALQNDAYLLWIQDKSFLHGFALLANIKIKAQEGRRVKLPFDILWKLLQSSGT